MNRISHTSMAELPERAVKGSPLRMVAAGLMLAAGACILAFAISGSDAANRDYVSYWAAGQQLVHHGNPYDSEAVLRLERAAGLVGQQPLLMRNPPLAFVLTLPLGLVSVRVGAIVWSLALVAALMASIRMLWIVQGRPRDRLYLAGYVFPPALACLLAGQVGIFLLLGVTLFLFLHRSRPSLAGASLLLCALKPHLFLPCGIVLVAWIVLRKAYPILLGAAAALLASLALLLFLNAGIWSQYAHGERAENIQNLFIPCLSVLLRIAIDRNALWIQALPELAGCAWAIWYFWKRRERWSWVDHGALLLLVSVMVAPYAWFTDEVLLLPAILAGLYRSLNAGRSFVPFGCIAGVALIEVLAGVPLASGLYVWTAPAWLAWYLYAIRGMEPSGADPAEHEVRDDRGLPQERSVAGGLHARPVSRKPAVG